MYYEDVHISLITPRISVVTDKFYESLDNFIETNVERKLLLLFGIWKYWEILQYYEKGKRYIKWVIDNNNDNLK